MPHVFHSGTVLDPNKVNENFGYIKGAIEDKASMRFEHSVLTYGFYADANWANLSADNRGYRITPPATMLLERSFFNYWGSGSVNVTVSEMESPTSQVVSNTFTTFNPIHKIDCSATGSIVKKTVCVGPMVLSSGSTYRFEMSATGHVHDYAELVLHLRADRFFTGSVESDEIVMIKNMESSTFEEDDSVDAEQYRGWIQELVTGSARNYSARRAVKPMLFTVRNLATNTPDIFGAFPVPKVDQFLYALFSSVNTVQCFADTTSSANSDYGLKLNVVDQDNEVQADLQVSVLQGSTVGFGELGNAQLENTVENPFASSSGSIDKAVNLFNQTTGSVMYKQYGYLWVD